MVDDSKKTTVLIVGARGFLGSQILDAVVAKGQYNVKVLIRPNSDASKIENMDAAADIQIVRSDMMDKESLLAAIGDDDDAGRNTVVINTANGYMQGNPEIDTVGANNLVDACKVKGVKRYIYCSVLTCDNEGCANVEHFYHKKLHEDYAKEQGVPYIALRPGAFLDQATDYLGDYIKTGSSWALSAWSKTVPIGMIYTPDLAKYRVDSIELPDEVNGPITIGWSRPIAYEEVISICSTKLGLDKSMRCIEFPWMGRMIGIYTIGLFSSFTAELLRMFNYFDTGAYVNDEASIKEQEKYFGEPPPTPEDAIGRYVDALLLQKKKDEENKEKEEEVSPAPAPSQE